MAKTNITREVERTFDLLDAAEERHGEEARHTTRARAAKVTPEQRHEQWIREGVRDGGEPPVTQRADEQSRLDHHSTPSVAATLSAECTPSS